MNKLLKIVLVIFILKAAVVFLLFVGALTAWMNGAPAILLPGLGLVVTMPVYGNRAFDDGNFSDCNSGNCLAGIFKNAVALI